MEVSPCEPTGIQNGEHQVLRKPLSSYKCPLTSCSYLWSTGPSPSSHMMGNHTQRSSGLVENGQQTELLGNQLAWCQRFPSHPNGTVTCCTCCAHAPPCFNPHFQITASDRFMALLIRAEVPHCASLGNQASGGNQAAEDNWHLS